jgi:hypothetical protein
MRYTKPNVLATVRANVAIQSGANGGRKALNIKPDHQSMNLVFSTSGAYEADE